MLKNERPSIFGSSGKKTTPPEVDEVKRILSNLEKSNIAPMFTLKIGDEIRVLDGPFIDYKGRIDEIDSNTEKLKVTVDIFGRDTPVELDFTQVEKA